MVNGRTVTGGSGRNGRDTDQTGFENLELAFPFTIRVADLKRGEVDVHAGHSRVHEAQIARTCEAVRARRKRKKSKRS